MKSPYQNRLDERKQTILDECASLLSLVERSLFAETAKGKTAASCKNAFLKIYGITARLNVALSEDNGSSWSLLFNIEEEPGEFPSAAIDSQGYTCMFLMHGLLQERVKGKLNMLS